MLIKFYCIIATDLNVYLFLMMRKLVTKLERETNKSQTKENIKLNNKPDNQNLFKEIFSWDQKINFKKFHG